MLSRNEQQIIQLIMEVAAQDSQIRAVLLNGSRANPNLEKDIFQDYDIVYAVTDIAAYIRDPDWIDIFGERMILQLPEDMELYPIREWLFRDTALKVSTHLGYTYPFEDDKKVLAYLKDVQQLPKDAEMIYYNDDSEL